MVGQVNQRYPDYDVQSKRQGPSWNEPTRRVIDQRLAIPREPRFFDPQQWLTLQAVCARILPQPTDLPAVPLAALVDSKAFHRRGDGYRDMRLPTLPEAWRKGLAALDAEAHALHGKPFAQLGGRQQDDLLTAMQKDQLHHPAWGTMPAKVFFSERVVHDITAAYYGHPTAWNDIGFGGPASPRGYVRLAANARDAWEPAEAKPGHEDNARKLNRRVR
jgi:hypothetical protein